MSLEKTIEELERTNEERFITNKNKHQKLQDILRRLDITIEITSAQKARIDDIAIAVKKRSLRTNDETIEETAQIIDDKRRVYRTPTPLNNYELLRNKEHQYATRFKKILEQLDNTPPGYDDLALTLDYLRTNNYIRKKSEDNTLFAQQKKLLEERIINYLTPKQETKKRFFKKYYTRAERIYARTATLTTAALLILSTTPTAMYERILG